MYVRYYIVYALRGSYNKKRGVLFYFLRKNFIFVKLNILNYEITFTMAYHL